MSAVETKPPRRDALLAVGLNWFSTHPYDEVSMDDVAADAGVAKGLLYYYFGSKRGLYVAAVRAAASELREQWDTDRDAQPAQRLADGLDAYLDYAATHADGYRTLIAGGVGTDPEVRSILSGERDLVIRRIVEALDLGEPTASLRIALQGWMSFIEGATLEWLDAGSLERSEVRDLLLAALNGVLAAAVGTRM
jgi:AcrR family transcriptional regulator